MKTRHLALIPLAWLALVAAAQQDGPAPAAVPSASATQPAQAAADDEDDEDGGGRVVGGEDADAYQNRWQAELFSRHFYSQQDVAEDTQARLRGEESLMLSDKDPWEMKHRCGGVYIGDNFVLTAAHCIGKKSNPNAVADFKEKQLIRLGTADLASEGLVYAPADVAVHEEYYNNKMDAPANDIAIIRITPFNDAAKRARIENLAIRVLDPARGDRRVAALDNLRVTGWGRTLARLSSGSLEMLADGKTRNPMSRRLQQVNLTARPAACTGLAGYKEHLEGKIICAMGARGKDSCNGDSGGPLTRAQGAADRVLVGLVSYGKGCAQAGQPGTYTDVAAFATWIAGKKTLMAQSAGRR